MYGGFDYIHDSLNNYRAAKIDRRISPNDVMNNAKYFEIGMSAVENIAIACVASRLREVKKVLDLPCGHGTVLRHLVHLFPEAEFDACDINRDGVDFCAATFGARPIYSSKELTDLDFETQYDLIWVGSLFTHTSLEVTRRWVAHLARFLSPKGIVVATFHGRVCPHLFHVVPYIRKDLWLEILDDYSSSGYGFRDYPHLEPNSVIPGGYGNAIAKPHVTIKELEVIPDIRIYLYRERAWADHQDVVAFGRPAYDAQLPDKCN
ncbi:class I SAM-dependent methyltransferase [candidate division CSSED10-310 bacterium]|uniref:Class I SAM-dependent methyltransferase n=1 Tax=candidate division CSSED10-310 bacterium TaxID=2855610 RepID=A0ABV6YVN3_UNCC1